MCATLAVEADEWVRAEVEMFDSEVCDFLDPGSGVVEEQHQRPVPQCQTSLPWQPAQEILPLVGFEEMSLGGCCPFHRYGRHPLAHLQHFRFLGGDVVEEGVQGREPLVPGPDVVAPLSLQVAQEAQHCFEAEVLEAESGDLGALLLRQKAEQETHRVPIAAHRRWPEPLHRHQVIDEERVHHRPERAALAHRRSPAVTAKASNRRLASSSRAGVIVR